MKLVTTAAALEILGDNYRYQTVIEYGGRIKGGVVDGRLYIRGGGDPTLGSSHFAREPNAYAHDRNAFFPQWLDAVRRHGITAVAGDVVADESIFDTEGVSMKWLREDLGSYYGAGSYGISVFDNIYRLYVDAGPAGSRPEVIGSEPPMQLRFHNYLTSAPVASDSTFIVGSPFSPDRYLYGLVPANSKMYLLRGDIPDPPLFLAQYVYAGLQSAGVRIEGEPTSIRILSENNRLTAENRTPIIATTSPSLREIVRITNERSHNLYADALLKTIGAAAPVRRGETLSTFGRGIRAVREHWMRKGLNASGLVMHDGSGLAPTSRVTASFIVELLIYMAARSPQSEAFISSLPQAGLEGSVRNFLKDTPLQGRTVLKSGGMSSVRSYAGYIDGNGKRLAAVVIVNGYNGSSLEATREIEKLLVALN
jgi:D-alanyl-D-alanine carboxypeptidase/D-alanyl-D-alanine-endopeptidase (penicillin-binding protein 4)